MEEFDQEIYNEEMEARADAMKDELAERQFEESV